MHMLTAAGQSLKIRSRCLEPPTICWSELTRERIADSSCQIPPPAVSGSRRARAASADDASPETGRDVQKESGGGDADGASGRREEASMDVEGSIGVDDSIACVASVSISGSIPSIPSVASVSISAMAPVCVSASSVPSVRVALSASRVALSGSMRSTSRWGEWPLALLEALPLLWSTRELRRT